MGEKEFGILKYYIQHDGTYHEAGEIKDVTISLDETEAEHETPRFSAHNWSATFDLAEQDMITFRRRFCPRTMNNWRKMNGEPKMRKVHLRKMRWHG